MTHLDLVNVSEAARRTGLPRSTIRNWIRRDDRLHPAGLDADGKPLYDYAKVLALAAGVVRRRPKPPSS